MPIYISMTVLTVLFGIAFERSRAGTYKLDGYKISYTDKEPSMFFLILILATFVFVSGFQTAFGDTTNYMSQFRNLDLTFRESLTSVWDEKSPLFIIYMTLIKTFTDDAQWFILITALLSNFFVWRVMKDTSVSIPISCYLFICSGLALWAMNGIRQFLVATILFSCYKLILNGKWFKWFLLLFVLYYCHTSVLFLLPVYFLYRRKPWTTTTMVFIAIVLIVGLFYSQFSDTFFDIAEGTAFEEYDKQQSEVESTGLLRVAFMIIPAILSFIYRKDIEQENSPLLNLSSNASVLSAGIYIVASIGAGNLIGRIAVYSDLFVYVILMPYILRHIFHDKNKSYIAYAYLIVSGLFYYYQQYIVFEGIWYSYWLGWFFV